MSKRQGHVFANREIPHLWAHQTQDEARNGTGSFYFRGASIYSYGSHSQMGWPCESEDHGRLHSLRRGLPEEDYRAGLSGWTLRPFLITRKYHVMLSLARS